ncbi:Ferredoxin subunit of nitrite reductase or a ring-hydroxylating dioxygenase [Paenibacillus sp. yr247]|uniref:Rieske (2Fe-2S) protein n=1 Tax=Paenibacillus sp. yr247 TaxID=1761880 RepID=UPI00088C260F|nr:Rieske (2Fe-2S) protein [Paenibacillus sp. yr247]SDO28913.1 Ferredoxin subunit of nitrite reductase or a ring-hydroxylating dioxygenase [Paenibacillus sp. yr247]
MKEKIIGPKDQFTTFPAEVQVKGKRYFLTEEEGTYNLLSSVCPHAGYTVELENGELECPMHGWTFEGHTGRCHNVPSARLASYEVILKDGMLFARMA